MAQYGFDSGGAAGSGLLQGLADGIWRDKAFKQQQAEQDREQEMFKLQKDLLGIKKQQNQLELGKQKMAMSFIQQLVQMQNDAKARNQNAPSGQTTQESGSDKSMLMEQQGGVGMQAAMSDPLMAMVMKFATGLDMPGVADDMETRRHNRAIEGQSDARLEVSKGQLGERTRGNDIREMQIRNSVTPVPFTSESGSQGTTFFPKFGTQGQTVQTAPSPSQKPIQEDNLPLWINDQMQTPPVGTTPQQAMDNGFHRVTAGQKTTIQATGNVEGILSQIESLMNDVYPGGESTMGRLVGGIQRKGGALLQSNKQAAQLESLINGTLAPIIRSLGEKGALANEDVARARALLPELTDRADVAWNKLEQLKALFQDVKKNAMGSGGDADMVYNPDTGTLEPVK